MPLKKGGFRRPSPPSGTACRCSGATFKHRNLLAYAPERLHDEITADYNDMILSATREEIEARRKAFIRKWRLKHRAVADSLEESERSLVRLHPAAAKPVAQRPYDQCDRTIARRV